MAMLSLDTGSQSAYVSYETGSTGGQTKRRPEHQPVFLHNRADPRLAQERKQGEPNSDLSPSGKGHRPPEMNSVSASAPAIEVSSFDPMGRGREYEPFYDVYDPRHPETPDVLADLTRFKVFAAEDKDPEKTTSHELKKRVRFLCAKMDEVTNGKSEPKIELAVLKELKFFHQLLKERKDPQLAEFEALICKVEDEGREKGLVATIDKGLIAQCKTERNLVAVFEKIEDSMWSDSAYKGAKDALYASGLSVAEISKIQKTLDSIKAHYGVPVQNLSPEKRKGLSRASKTLKQIKASYGTHTLVKTMLHNIRFKEEGSDDSGKRRQKANKYPKNRFKGPRNEPEAPLDEYEAAALDSTVKHLSEGSQSKRYREWARQVKDQDLALESGDLTTARMPELLRDKKQLEGALRTLRNDNVANRSLIVRIDAEGIAIEKAIKEAGEYDGLLPMSQRGIDAYKEINERDERRTLAPKIKANFAERGRAYEILNPIEEKIDEVEDRLARVNATIDLIKSRSWQLPDSEEEALSQSPTAEEQLREANMLIERVRKQIAVLKKPRPMQAEGYNDKPARERWEDGQWVTRPAEKADHSKFRGREAIDSLRAIGIFGFPEEERRAEIERLETVVVELYEKREALDMEIRENGVAAYFTSRPPENRISLPTAEPKRPTVLPYEAYQIAMLEEDHAEAIDGKNAEREAQEAINDPRTDDQIVADNRAVEEEGERIVIGSDNGQYSEDSALKSQVAEALESEDKKSVSNLIDSLRGRRDRLFMTEVILHDHALKQEELGVEGGLQDIREKITGAVTVEQRKAPPSEPYRDLEEMAPTERVHSAPKTTALKDAVQMTSGRSRREIKRLLES